MKITLAIIWKLVLSVLIIIASVILYKYIVYIIKEWIGEDEDVQ